MGHVPLSPSYDDLLYEFKRLLDHALDGATLAAPFAMLDVSVMLALLDVSYAVRQGRPTDDVVKRACLVFAQYAVSQNAPPPDPSPHHLKLVT